MLRIRILQEDDGLFYWSILRNWTIAAAGLLGFASEAEADAEARRAWNAYEGEVD